MASTTALILIGVLSFLSVLLSICLLGFLWIIFEKAGRKGWEAIIPIWNLYVFFKIARKTPFFWIIFLLPIIRLVYLILTWLSFNYTNLQTIRPIISWILGLCTLILPIIARLELPYGITKKFGKSKRFYIGMLFLTPIFMGILAFGKAKYEEREPEKKYNFKKFILIALGIALLWGLGEIGLNYNNTDARKNIFILNNNFSLFNNKQKTTTIDIKEFTCYAGNGVINQTPDRDANGRKVNCYNDKGLKHGKWLGYNGYGIAIQETNYIDGVLNGMEIWTWPEDGKKRYEVNYIDGKREGEGRSYYEDGSLEFIENYKNGVLEGKKEYYFKSGKRKRVEYLEHGKTVKASNYYEDYDIEQVEVYINGEKKGYSYIYPDDISDEEYNEWAKSYFYHYDYTDN